MGHGDNGRAGEDGVLGDRDSSQVSDRVRALERLGPGMQVSRCCGLRESFDGHGIEEDVK